jgi:N-acetylglucosamine repressor
MQKATQQQTKEHNTSLVLSTIFEHENISRAEIARVTSLTRTTVSDIVSELMAEGLVEEVGIGSSIGGKSPILLSLVEDSRYLIGLDLAYNKFCGAIVNLRGRIREQFELPITNNCTGDEALGMVYSILDQLIHTQRRPLIGIGVGTPGLVNTGSGMVVNAVNLEWKNLPLGSLLSERYHLPVSILNDSQAAAMGEYMYGSGSRPEDNLIVINVRRGIGAGVVINGRLFQGDGGGAGEIGHVVVVREGGLPCRCGNLGCLETVASAQAVIQRMQMSSLVANALPGETGEISLDALEQSFRAGDALSQQVIQEAGHYLGLAIASLVGALNIQRIVLVGEMTLFGRPWLEEIRETVSHMTLARLAQDTQIEIGELGENGIILGASAILLKDYSLLFMHQNVN